MHYVFYIKPTFSNLLSKHQYLVGSLLIVNTILILRTVLELLMGRILHAIHPLQSILSIEIGRAISLKTSLQYATLTSYLYTFYQVGKALHMIKGSYLMLYTNMGSKYHLKSTILVMQGTQTLTIAWYHIEEYGIT
jgi:hypothetical protein